MRRTLLLILILASAATLARAAEVSRVLKTFDFEERRLGNEESLPMRWVKLHGPGLPHYVNGRLDTERHRGGRYSFRFELNGGSLVYRYGPGLLPVQPGGHYRVDAFCQTTALPNARARVTAYLVDVDGHTIESSVTHSALFASEQDSQIWKKLSVEVTAGASATSMVIELELLQPELYASGKSAERPIYEQDIYGSCWWDDITVSQVPELALRTGHAGNIVKRGEPLRISVMVSDRFTDDLVAQISVKDALGREIYQRTGTPDVSQAVKVGDRRKRMILELPQLPPGWYEMRLLMSSAGLPLGTQSMAFIVLPDSGVTSPPDGRFGFVATNLPPEVWGDLPDVLPLLSAGRVKLALWSADSDADADQGRDSFDRLIKHFRELGITPTACLLEPPPALAEKLNGSGWKQLLNVSPGVWQPDLAFLVSRHANHLDRWQIGADGSAAFVTDPAMREVYHRVYQEFAKLVDKPDLAMPWPAWYELSGKLPATVALDVPPSVLPSQIPLYIQDLHTGTDHNLSLTLELLNRSSYGRDVQMRDLAQRVIYALSADAKRIDLPLPLTSAHDQDGVSTEPDEVLLVMRTLITTLSGARYRGRVSLAEGIEAFLFDRDGQGIMALWDRGDSGHTRELALNLGTRPVSIDLWGNTTPLLRPPGEHEGRVNIHVGPMPMFLVDIDGPQAQLRASVAIDRPLIESAFRPHKRHVRFTNAYPQAILGTLHVRGPSGWTINPPTFNFSLNPGETFDRELTIQFPYNSFAGNKTLTCEFYIQGERDPIFSVPLQLKLGLSDVGMQSSALRTGRDVLIQQIITNYGDSPISYSAFALYPDQARQERLVTSLAPGSSTIRRYRFENVQVTKGAKVRVGLKELEGPRILNDEVEVQ